MKKLFSGKDNLFLGIDIGDSSLKMVELKKRGRRIYLSNYAYSENIREVNFNKIDDVDYLAQAIFKVIKEANIKARRATVSLPTFAVFSSIVNIVNTDKKNLAQVVKDEAKKVMPLPLEEMILDWKIMPNEKGQIPSVGNMQVFLTGSSKKLIRKYLEVFKKANIALASLETETFSLVRSLLGNDPEPIMIVEIGSNSTDLSIVENSIPVFNRSLIVSSSTITQVLADKLNLEYKQAEQFKIDMGCALEVNLQRFNRSTDSNTIGNKQAKAKKNDNALANQRRGNRDDKKVDNDELSQQAEIPALISETIEPIVTEMRYMIDFYQSQHDKIIEKIVLAGGGSLFINLPEYFAKCLNAKVIIGDPWNRIIYPLEIKPVLQNLGPKLAVAIGLAMREIY